MVLNHSHGYISLGNTMSRRLLHKFLNNADNLLLFQTEIGTINSVPLIYSLFSNCSVFIRSTYCLDDHNILVDLVPKTVYLKLLI